MLEYVIKSGLCLLVLFSFYKLFLEGERFHRIKRVYLLGALGISLVLPLITITYQTEVAFTETGHFVPISEVTGAGETSEIDWLKELLPAILLVSYFIGFSIFAFRFYKNLRSLISEARSNEQLKNFNYIYVLLGKKLDPYSFFQYIFLNKKEFKNNTISRAVIEHEKAHVDQKHSLDLLLLELIHVIFWFNPVFIFIKRSVKLNHEFLADDCVIKKNFSPLEYSNILFQYSSGHHHNSLSSPISHSLIKKRIIMITKSFSLKRLLLRSLIFLPVLGGCLYLFNEEIVAKPVYTTEKTTVPSEIIEVPFEKQRSDFIANSQSKLQEPSLKITVQGEKVWVNDKKTEIRDFAKTIDAMTSGLKEEELKDLNIHMKTSNSDHNFMENLNREFAKTRLSKVTGRGILPPPPPKPPKPGEVPSPPEVNDEIINLPPPAPPKASPVANPGEAETVHRERAKEWKRLKDEQRKVIKEEQRKIREIEQQLQQDEKLTEAEKNKLLREVERKEAESQRKINDIERKRMAIEREHMAMERKQMEAERKHMNVPAPPPPPHKKSVLSKYPRDAVYYLNDEEISYEKAMEIIKQDKAIQVDIRKNSENIDVVKIYI